MSIVTLKKGISLRMLRCEEIGRIKYDDNIDIVARINQFGGESEPGLDIRKFIKMSDGSVIHGKQGIRIHLSKLEAFKEWFDEVSKVALKERGGRA